MSRPTRALRSTPPSGRSAPARSGTRPSSRSGCRSGRSLVNGITSQPMTAPTRPTGTLIQNTHCQPSVSSTRPPIAGPALSPTAWAADWMPSARPRRSGPAAVTMMATLFDESSAAPIACRTRKAMSTGKFGAKPQSAEPSTNSRKPAGVQELAPDHVGKPPEDRQERRHRQQIADGDPAHGAESRAEFELEPWAAASARCWNRPVP